MQNLAAAGRVTDRGGSIKEAHLAEPELLVIDVSGAGDTTVMAFQDAVARAWETATAERTTRDPKHLRRRSGCMWRRRHRGMIRLGGHRLLRAGFMRPLRAALPRWPESQRGLVGHYLGV